MANRFHDEYVPLKNEIDNMRREYLGLERLPELHEEEGSIVTPDRFQQQQHSNFYAGKLSAATGNFTRPTPVTTLSNQMQNHSLPAVDQPHITPLNPSHGFLPPPAPPTGLSRGLSTGKPSEISNTTRIQQTPTSIGMHPTFRSDFNVSLRYFLVLFFIFSI